MKVKRKVKKPEFTWQQSLPWVMFIGGVIGLVASFSLAYDKIKVVANPHYIPNCDLNPVLSCLSEMNSKQASIHGIPNPFFGIVIFSMLVMFSLALLAGAVVKRWLWVAAQAAATVGVIFMHYLFFEAAFRIHSICPWCFVTWMVTIPIFFGVTIYNLRVGYLGHSRFKYSKKFGDFVHRHANDVLVLWYLIIIGILIIKFWYYWKTLF
jgi:uncharacterized membrane protein